MLFPTLASTPFRKQHPYLSCIQDLWSRKSLLLYLCKFFFHIKYNKTGAISQLSRSRIHPSHLMNLYTISVSYEQYKYNKNQLFFFINILAYMFLPSTTGFIILYFPPQPIAPTNSYSSPILSMKFIGTAITPG